MKLIFTLIVLIIIFCGAVVATPKAFPESVQIAATALANCSLSDNTVESDGITKTGLLLGKIWRLKEWYFPRNELIKDETLVLSYISFVYERYGQSCKESAMSLLSRYISNGYDINLVSPKTGSTILHEAIFFEELDLVKRLLLLWRR